MGEKLCKKFEPGGGRSGHPHTTRAPRWRGGGGGGEGRGGGGPHCATAGHGSLNQHEQQGALVEQV
jgi:hypothetical protein